MELCIVAIFLTVQGHLPRLIIDIDYPAIAYSPGQELPTPVEVVLSDADALNLIKVYRLPDADLCLWIA